MFTMHRPRTLAVAVVALALTTLAAAEALAQQQRAPRAARAERETLAPGEWGMERMAQRLDLSEEQQTAIAALREASREKSVDLRKETARVRNELKGEMLKDKPDERVVVRLTERLGKLRTDLQVDRARTRLAIREQLSPEQRDRMLLMGQGRERAGRQGSEGWRRGPGRGEGGRGACCLHGSDGQTRRGPAPRAGRS